MTNADLTRRFGRFETPTDLVTIAPEQCLAILSGMLIVRAEKVGSTNTIQYMAYSDQFEECPSGDEATAWYDYEIKDLIGRKYHVTWKRRPR